MPAVASESFQRFIGSPDEGGCEGEFANILVGAVERSKKHLATGGQNCDVEVWVLGFLKYCYHVEVQKNLGDTELFACVACFVCA